ncbi:ArsS family sensor histidine kinase [Campylobacter sp. MIT 97-5078]|uniref:ArsS family sensor histidine kinase n=1 Tax=Campylobacter sp. MIT 97-5078 TaxID=1548153 RepID=UPI000513BBE0|nr:ArsS family sensor histidine kinase [Campylobacter sp. MIT 97-5078]KGI56009.1 ATPase [Campylobacter sp. MIT 97-5078]TQR23554.1 sensor histidine kinase [Campylobacter sp. MIT 97-5078]
MNRSSIFYTITLIFILAIVSVILAFLWLIEYDQQNYTKVLNDKYTLVANARLLYFNGVMSEEEFHEQTKHYKMTQVVKPSEIRKVIFRGDVLARAQTTTGLIEIISYEKEIFLKIIHDGKLYLYNDQDYEGYRYFKFKALAFGVILVLVLLYIFVIKKLRPLTSLKKQIDKFAQNKLDEIKDVSSGNDEISQVAQAFFQAITQIQKMNQSRQFFIRNIMHELKTPITKGLITLEMLEDNKYKERLRGIFDRLEILINEFAAIEQITSGAAFINRKKYNILDILDEAKEIAMNDDKKIRIHLEQSFFVNVDFKLFTTAIKNMIDNGVKHSSNEFIELEICKQYLCFKNQGKALEKPLEYYTQAFTQGAKQKDSFGLGLYIVDTILKSHNMKLSYELKDSFNLFYFKELEHIIVKE